MHLVYHQSMLKKWTECNVQIRFPCSLEECGTCCVQSYLLNLLSPAALITEGRPIGVHKEEMENNCSHSFCVMLWLYILTWWTWIPYVTHRCYNEEEVENNHLQN